VGGIILQSEVIEL